MEKPHWPDLHGNPMRLVNTKFARGCETRMGQIVVQLADEGNEFTWADQDSENFCVKNIKDYLLIQSNMREQDIYL